MIDFKNFRKEASLSQQEIADKLGVSQQCVAKWESGESLPRADKLPQLAEILGCTVDELLKTD